MAYASTNKMKIDIYAKYEYPYLKQQQTDERFQAKGPLVHMGITHGYADACLLHLVLEMARQYQGGLVNSSSLKMKWTYTWHKCQKQEMKCNYAYPTFSSS
eukprot:11715146-Karenia_brevis.AAC.1